MARKKPRTPLHKSFIYAVNGMILAAREEWHIWMIGLGFIPVGIAAWLLELSAVEIAILVVAVWQVVIFELINSAIERLTDKVSPEYNKVAGQIKDISSASVFLSLVLCIGIFLIITIPALIKVLN
ncbi:MAG: diacylglycerol kinase [Spirochaetales bacterium]|nr:diacylglycerol kinase [Spirochaetales bacterium]